MPDDMINSYGLKVLPIVVSATCLRITLENNERDDSF